MVSDSTTGISYKLLVYISELPYMKVQVYQRTSKLFFNTLYKELQNCTTRIRKISEHQVVINNKTTYSNNFTFDTKCTIIL